MRYESMKKRILPVAVVLALGTLALDADAGIGVYLQDQSGKVVRSGTGTCVQTTNWTPALSTAECRPAAEKTAAGPVSSSPQRTARAPVPVTEKITMDADALFDFDKSDIKPKGKEALDEVVRELNLDGAELGLIVTTGHTDSSGSTAYNKDLSMRRAESVKSYLMSKGIDGDLISTVGEGERLPSGDNATAAGRTENRHVEIEVTSTRTTQ